MKNFLLLLIFLFSGITVFAQKTKTVKIWENDMFGETLQAEYFYNEANELQSTELLLLARNSEYSYLIDYFVVYAGPATNLYAFLTSLEKFYDENEGGTTSTISGLNVHTSNSMGTVGLWVWGKKPTDGYHIFKRKTITKIKNSLAEWADEKKITYK